MLFFGCLEVYTKPQQVNGIAGGAFLTVSTLVSSLCKGLKTAVLKLMDLMNNNELFFYCYYYFFSGIWYGRLASSNSWWSMSSFLFYFALNVCPFLYASIFLYLVSMTFVMSIWVGQLFDQRSDVILTSHSHMYDSSLLQLLHGPFPKGLHFLFVDLPYAQDKYLGRINCVEGC